MSDCSETEDSDHIWTEYYNTEPDLKSHTQALVEEPDRNYNEYTLFCLRSHLMDWLSRHWSPQIDVSLPTFPRANRPHRRYLTVVPQIAGRNLEMTSEMKQDLRRQVQKYGFLKSVVLFPFETTILSSDQRLIPLDWIKTMVPYLMINPELNPSFDQYALYVELGQYPDYLTIFRELSVNLIRQIQNMYNKGYVFHPSDSIIDNWELVSVDPFDHIYRPIWDDLRITRGNLTDFLLSRIHGNKIIRCEIGSNFVIRHLISRLLLDEKYIIDGVDLKVEVDDLVRAQQIASLIEYGQNIGEGHVIVKHVSSKEDVERYQMIGTQMLDEYDFSFYRTEDKRRPYTVSFLFSYDSLIDLRLQSSLLWMAFMKNKLTSTRGKKKIHIPPYYYAYPTKTELSLFQRNLTESKIDKKEEVPVIKEKQDYADPYLDLDVQDVRESEDRTGKIEYLLPEKLPSLDGLKLPILMKTRGEGIKRDALRVGIDESQIMDYLKP